MAKPFQAPDLSAEDMELKMTPLLDVIFQLIIFLMCALHFRSLTTKLETVLPLEQGIGIPLKAPEEETIQVKITLIHNKHNLMAPSLNIDGRPVSGYDELARHLNGLRQANPAISVIIESQEQIPAQCIIDAVNACNKAGIEPALTK
jgi:biopolymer transport protein ExbD